MPITIEQEEELIFILDTLASYRARLNPRSRQFVDDQTARFAEHKSNMSLSPKQWTWLRDLYRQATE